MDIFQYRYSISIYEKYPFDLIYQIDIMTCLLAIYRPITNINMNEVFKTGIREGFPQCHRQYIFFEKNHIQKE